MSRIPAKPAEQSIIPSARGILAPGLHEFIVGARPAAPLGLLGANSMGVQKVDIYKIRLDGGTQSRAGGVDREVVEEYAEAMRNGAVFPAVEAIFDGTDYWLTNGFHRIEAAMLAGLLAFDVEATAGTQRDAWLVSRGANKHNGLHRSNADKRYSVESVLLDEVCVRWTDGRIADLCGVQSPLVAAVRAELVASLRILEIDERTAIRDGQEYVVKTTKIGRKSKSKPEPETPLRWDEHYFDRDLGEGVKACFMQVASSPSVWIAIAHDAQVIADYLQVQPQHLEEGYTALKLVGMNPDRQAQLEELLGGKIESYLEGDPDLVRIAMALSTTSLRIEMIDERVAIRDGKEYIVNTSGSVGRPAKPKIQSADPEPQQTWQEYYFAKDRSGTRVVFMQLASVPNVWLAAGDDAELVALAISTESSIETTYLDDQGFAMLKLASMDEIRLGWLETLLDGQVESYLEGDKELIAAAVQLAPVAVPNPRMLETPSPEPTRHPQVITHHPAADDGDWYMAWLKSKKLYPKGAIIFMAVGASKSVWIAVNDDAIDIAKKLGVKTAEMQAQTHNKNYSYIPVLKFWMGHESRVRRMVDLLGGEHIVCHIVQDPTFKMLADRLPTVDFPGEEKPRQTTEADLEYERAQRRDQLVERPDPARSSENFPIPGLSSVSSTPITPLSVADPIELAAENARMRARLMELEAENIALRSQDDGGQQASANGSHAEADQADPERRLRQQMMNTNTQLMLDKEALRQQMDSLTAQVEVLEAQLAGTPLGLPADPDPLREKLLRSLWYLDQGMAVLAVDRNLPQADSAILKYCDDQAVRTTMAHYQIIEHLLVEDTLESIREIAANADHPRQAVEKLLYEMSKEEYQGRSR
ncbi:MAG: hypothetical protein L0Z53_15060 [Acidobacteriales bacterium]|nr:hypothetical protein [Terriglobales bacterium]